MENTISSLMLQDHARIINLLKEFEDSQGKGAEMVAKSFDKFKWKLELHIFIEERVIFGYTRFSRGTNTMVRQVLDEHKIILSMSNSIQKSLLAASLHIDVSDLKQILDEHRNFEDRELYPTLDKELDDSMKQFMIDQLKTRLY